MADLGFIGFAPFDSFHSGQPDGSTFPVSIAGQVNSAMQQFVPLGCDAYPPGESGAGEGPAAVQIWYG